MKHPGMTNLISLDENKIFEEIKNRKQQTK